MIFDDPLQMYSRPDKVDFTANAEIPDFDKLISVIRSRELMHAVPMESR